MPDRLRRGTDAGTRLVVRVSSLTWDPLVDVTSRHGVELTFMARAPVSYRIAHLYHAGDEQHTLCGTRIGDGWLVPADGMPVCRRCVKVAES